MSDREPRGRDGAGRRRFLIQLGGTTFIDDVRVDDARRLVGSRSDSDSLIGARWSDTHPLPNADAAVTPVPGTRPEFTPLDRHYRVDTNTRAPEIDGARWRLKVDGLVQRPLTFTLDDLRQYDPMHQFVTLSCISNPIGGDLISTTRWTGVSLKRLLPELIVSDPAATHLRFTSADGFFGVGGDRDDQERRTHHARVCLGRRAAAGRARISAAPLHPRSLRHEAAEMDRRDRRHRSLGAGLLGDARVGSRGTRDDRDRPSTCVSGRDGRDWRHRLSPAAAACRRSRFAWTTASGTRQSCGIRSRRPPGCSGAPESPSPRAIMHLRCARSTAEGRPQAAGFIRKGRGLRSRG